MLRLRNTLTGQVEPVVPIVAPAPGERPRIRMYTCGPTVYRYAHVGNLRTFMLADFIRRTLLYHGLDVLHVKNITDVGHMREERLETGGDRIAVAAEVEGRSPAEIAAHYTDAFLSDEALVNILPAHRFPRATEHIGEMLRLAEQLVDAGYAYATPDGTVYYDVSRYAGYGQLSGNTLDELHAGHRGEPESDKDDPADFALWKRSEPGRDATLSWDAPRWGLGFPGWHLECSAMSAKYLGDEFEIHTGGVDNIFPHHEDEIAQSAPISGHIPARHWVHGEHLLMSGRKMAKSAGNFERITDLMADGFDPLAFRYLVLTSRYRHKLDFSRRSLTGAQAALDSLRARVLTLGPAPAAGPWASPPAGAPGSSPAAGAPGSPPPGGLDDGSDRAHAPSAPLSADGMSLHAAFVDALDDDLDLPAALAVVRSIARSRLVSDEKRWLLLDADRILGLGLGAPEAAVSEAPSPSIAALLAERSAARVARDFARADLLRDQLRALGGEPIDHADGTSTWRRTDPADASP